MVSIITWIFFKSSNNRKHTRKKMPVKKTGYKIFNKTIYIFPITNIGPLGVVLPASLSSVTANASTLPKVFIF